MVFNFSLMSKNVMNWKGFCFNYLPCFLLFILSASRTESALKPFPRIGGVSNTIGRELGEKVSFECYVSDFDTGEFEKYGDIAKWTYNTSNDQRYSQSSSKYDIDEGYLQQNFKISSLKCADETIKFVCNVYLKRKSTQEKLVETHSVSIKVGKNPQGPKLTFQPTTIVENTEVRFNCTAYMGKQRYRGKTARNLEMFLQKTDGSGAVTNLPIDDSNRITTPDKVFPCAKHQTIITTFIVDKSHHDYTVTCKYTDVTYGIEEVELGFTRPDTSTTSTIATSATSQTTGTTKEPHESKASPIVGVVLGGLSGVVAFIVLIFVIVFYVSRKMKRQLLYVPDPDAPESTMIGSRVDLKMTGSNVMTTDLNIPVDAEEASFSMRPDASSVGSDTSAASSRATERKRSRSRSGKDYDDVTSATSATSRRRSRRRKAARDDSPDPYTDAESTRRTSRRSRRKR